MPDNTKDNDIYIDCMPTGESAKTIKTYNVPINSAYTEDAKKLDLMRTLIGLCIMLIYLMFVYFTSPLVYKHGVINVVNKMFSGESEEMRLKRIGSLDIYISTLILGLALFFFSKGAVGFNFIEIMGGFSVLLMYGLSYGLIQSNKIDGENFMATFVTGKGKITTKYPTGDNVPYFYQDFLIRGDNKGDGFIVDSLRYMFGQPLKTNGFVLATWVVFFILWELVFGLANRFDLYKLGDYYYLVMIYFPIVYMIPFILFLSLLFKKSENPI
jgi:hypothetical protein